MTNRSRNKKVLHLMLAIIVYWCPLKSLSQDLIQKFDPINKQLGLMAISNDGSFYVLGGGEISVRWTQSGEEWFNISKEVEFHSNPNHRPVDISPDDSLIAWVGNGVVRVFDIQLGKIISTFSKPDNDTSDFRGPIEFQPHTHHLAVSSIGTDEVTIIDYISGKPVQRVHHPQADPKGGNIDFSRDGQYLAYGGGSRGKSTLVHIFDLTAQKPVRVIETSNSYGVPDLDLSENGRWLATGARESSGDNGQMAEIWDVQKGNNIGRIDGRCEFLHFMDEDRYLAALITPDPQFEETSADQIQIWRVQDMKLMKSIELDGRRGENPARYTMLGSKSNTRLIVQYRGATTWIEMNSELVPVKPTHVAAVSVPPMISLFKALTQNSLQLQWSGGIPPFEIIFRPNLEQDGITLKTGIHERETTLLNTMKKTGFYEIISHQP